MTPLYANLPTAGQTLKLTIGQVTLEIADGMIGIESPSAVLAELSALPPSPVGSGEKGKVG